MGGVRRQLHGPVAGDAVGLGRGDRFGGRALNAVGCQARRGREAPAAVHQGADAAAHRVAVDHVQDLPFAREDRVPLHSLDACVGVAGAGARRGVQRQQEQVASGRVHAVLHMRHEARVGRGIARAADGECTGGEGGRGDEIAA